MCIACVMPTEEPIVFTLQSVPMLHAPGILTAMINDYGCRSKKIKAKALEVMRCWQSPGGKLTDEILIRLLKGEISYTLVKEKDEKSGLMLEHVRFTA